MNLTINKLTIENFAGFKKQTFEFNGQDARVYGANGTGKTTTATALQWLLFDKGLDLRKVDYIYGTSVGSQVGATLSSPLDWDTIWQEQIVKKLNETTPVSEAEMKNLLQSFEKLAQESRNAKAWVDGMSEISKNTQSDVSLEARRDMIRHRLGSMPLE